MSKLKTRLLKLSQKLDKLSSEMSEARGALNESKKRLKNVHGCSSVAEAKSKIEELEDARAEIYEDIDAGCDEVEELLG